MRQVNSGYEILSPIDGESILRQIELCGRVCYKSENRITPESARKFVGMLLESHHESVVEHVTITVRFSIDRGVSHELVRHRIASFSQESTRYCNYTKGKFDGQMTAISIEKHMKSLGSHLVWQNAMRRAEQAYQDLIALGESPQIARSVLPNSLKTEIIVTANLREWRTIFKQRTSKAAHPQMREVMCPLLDELRTAIPIIFDDIQKED